MQVAVPLFGYRVAPRFGIADLFLIAVISDGRVTQVRNVMINGDDWHDRLRGLEKSGIDVLLCGGFNRRFEPMAHSLGIEVVAGLAGDALELVHSYARGEELPFLCECPSNNRGRQRQGQLRRCRNGDAKRKR